MSEGAEKTEQPTSFKLAEARKKGRVAKSSDLVAVVGLASTMMFLVFASTMALKKMVYFFYELHTRGYDGLNISLLKSALFDAFNLWFFLSLPILGLASMAGLVGNIMQFGLLFSTHTLKPDITKLNPISGLKKMFSKDKLVEFIKQIIKFATVSGVIFYTISSYMTQIILLFKLDIISALSLMGDLLITIIIRVVLCFFAIAVADYFWQKHSFIKSMRMSKYEIKKEYRQQEGDPELKYERKRLAQENLEDIALENISEATVVITNPSHLAVAIKYDKNSEQAPSIVAKGTGSFALIIIKEANRRDLPVVRNVPLARDLQWLDIDEEIPENLYESVAEVLTFIYELSKKHQ